jgi:hypothetical protein
VQNEAFYATVAQVLPTLAIALAVEAHLLLKPQQEVANNLLVRACLPTDDVSDSYPRGRTEERDALSAA